MIPKPGNPHGAERSKLTKVTIKLDDETLQQLEELENYLPNVRGRRSNVVRRCIRREFESKREREK